MRRLGLRIVSQSSGFTIEHSPCRDFPRVEQPRRARRKESFCCTPKRRSGYAVHVPPSDAAKCLSSCAPCIETANEASDETRFSVLSIMSTKRRTGRSRPRIWASYPVLPLPWHPLIHITWLVIFHFAKMYAAVPSDHLSGSSTAGRHGGSGLPTRCFRTSILLEFVPTIRWTMRCELRFLPVWKATFSAVLDIVFSEFDCPLPGGYRQLHTTRHSCTNLLSPSSVVHLSCLECDGNYAKDDGNQCVQVQIPGAI